MDIKTVPFHMAARDIALVVDDHEEEGYGKPSLDWQAYLEASRQGACWATVAYDGDELVGYSVFFIDRNVNHKNRLEASNSGFYVIPKHRGRIIFKIMKAAHEFVKSLGVAETHYLLADDRVGKLLQKIGFKPTSTLWSVCHE